MVQKSNLIDNNLSQLIFHHQRKVRNFSSIIRKVRKQLVQPCKINITQKSHIYFLNWQELYIKIEILLQIITFQKGTKKKTHKILEYMHKKKENKSLVRQNQNKGAK